MTRQITPADLQPPENPGDGWYIIEAAGEYPTVLKLGEEKMTFTQQLTPEVLERVAEAGVPPEGLLLDKDHFSRQLDKPSEAMGWVRELAICEGSLAARIEWTSIGRQLIEGKIYRYFSTVYPPDPEQMRSGVFRPDRLIGLAITNKPHNAEGQPPITNRETPLPPGNSAPAEPNEQTQPNMTYPNELLALLGLAEGATDEEVLAAVQALKQGADAAADAEADSVVNSTEAEEGAKLTDEEKKECKDEVLANREHGLKYTRLLCQNKALMNRQTAQTAGVRKYAGNGKMPVITNRKGVDETELAVTNRAQEIVSAARTAGRKVNYWTAVAQARNEVATRI